MQQSKGYDNIGLYINSIDAECERFRGYMNHAAESLSSLFRDMKDEHDRGVFQLGEYKPILYMFKSFFERHGDAVKFPPKFNKDEIEKEIKKYCN